MGATRFVETQPVDIQLSSGRHGTGMPVALKVVETNRYHRNEAGFRIAGLSKGIGFKV
jgi:hypothetical protein